MREIILNRLQTIEREHDVSILYACESGSRGWGFDSQDSDYDVRFVYVHRQEWYCSLRPGRDVIEYSDNGVLDIVGWDLKKTLVLVSKSNPQLFEWLRSPIVYCEKQGMMDELRRLVESFFSGEASLHHYCGMAQRCFLEFSNDELVRSKHYLYVLRPLLACLWVEADRGTPPMRFAESFCMVKDPEVMICISELLKRKVSGLELGKGPRIPILDDFIKRELDRITSRVTGVEHKQTDVEELDRLFLRWMKIAWD